MDITPQDATQQPISDDQELAKALAGVLPEEQPTQPAQASMNEIPPLQFEETPAPIPTPAADSVQPAPVEPQSTDITPLVVPSEPVAQTTDLNGIKKTALEELRPLMDKVSLSAEEKFNTYLMLIRSTDDASLIEPAHTTAQAITDESVRAQALLDVIKEIDYLSQGQNSVQ